MATITSNASGDWGTGSTWIGGVVPVNGDDVIIASGHIVRMNISQSGFTNGLASLVINGTLRFKSTTVTYLKMNGNITGTGKLYVLTKSNVDFDIDLLPLVEGYTNTHKYDSWGNANLDKPDGIPTTIDDVEFTLVDSIDAVEELPDSYYIDGINMYLHCSARYWNYHEAIMRSVVGSETRCTIMMNDTGTINVPTIKMLGWYPIKEFTQLSIDASINATQIILKEDLGLQQGDILAIGSGTEYGSTTETNKGLYTVQSYVSATKTVTLTTGLQTSRLLDDYVAIASRPIKISRTTGTAPYMTTKIDNVVLVGVKMASGGNLNSYGSPPATAPYCKGWIIRHCISTARAFCAFGDTFTIEDSLMAGSPYNYGYCSNSIINRFVAINCDTFIYPLNSNNVLDSGIIQNTPSSPLIDGQLKNTVLKNIYNLISGGYINSKGFYNCIIDSANSPPLFENSYLNKLVNCTFKSTCRKLFGYMTTKLFNCVFEDGYTVDNANLILNFPVQSFDHNQIIGNYAAWVKGGKIETENNKLKFICESSNYPVFRDYKILVQKNKIERFRIVGIKDFTGGTIKAELIDPANDPLIDPTTTPLATTSMADVKDTDVSMNINYNSTKAQELILRISAKNNTGNYILKELIRFNCRSREVIQ